MRQVPCGQGVAMGTKRVFPNKALAVQNPHPAATYLKMILILICVVKGCRINYIKEDFYYAENQKALL